MLPEEEFPVKEEEFPVNEEPYDDEKEFPVKEELPEEELSEDVKQEKSASKDLKFKFSGKNFHHFFFCNFFNFQAVCL